ncbi:PepSY domain-containing protein [Emcibacter sp.]|uniref:PepSY domain-containing protein n=1 Tax=Emcibacter sp. TaxID=1979954 RepID=UPI002AA8E516|nr:PepSY domain-containing protein [Emcibacter sp.]
MRKINYNFWLRRIHKWLGLIVGIQFLLWTLSGFIMSYFPIGEVHGDHLLNAEPVRNLSPAEEYLSPSQILQKFGDRPVEAIHLISYQGRPVYQVEAGEDLWLVDAVTGADHPMIGETEATAIARARYAGEAEVKSVSQITTPIGEIGAARLPLWRVDFNDDINSSFYISPYDATIVRVRSDIWRRHDFFWMLHIMDYENRSDINNWLLVFAASVGLFVILSGIILIFYAFSRRDFRWIRPGK